MHRRLMEAPGITDPAELTKRTASAVLSRLTDSTAATVGTSAAHRVTGVALARAPFGYRSRRGRKGKYPKVGN